MKKIVRILVCLGLAGGFFFGGAELFAASGKNGGKNLERKDSLTLAKELLESNDVDAALDFLEDALDQEQPEAYLLMGDLYLNGTGVYQDYELAEYYYEEALFMYKDLAGKSDKNDPELYRATSGLGAALMGSAYYTDALESFEEALNIAQKTYGSQSLQSAQMQNSIGTVYAAWGDSKLAKSYYDKALKIALAIESGNNRTVADIYNNMASLYMNQQKFNDAESNYQKAQAIYENLSGKESTDVALTYAKLALLLLNKGDNDKALSYAQTALKLQQKILGEYHSHTANTYTILAQIYEAKKDLITSLQNYVQALDVLTEIYGTHHPDVAEASFNLGMMAYRLGEWDLACQSLETTFNIYSETENFNQIMERSWLVYTTLQDPPKKFKNKVMDLKLLALTTGIDAAEDARISLSAKKESITAKALPLYYAAVDLYAQEMEEKTSFYYSELLRSRGFLEELGTEAALKLDGITDKERELFRQYTKEIDDLAKKVQGENTRSNSERNEEEIQEAASKLADARKKLQALDDSIARRIPKYTQLRDPSPVSFEEAKKWCGKDRVILEYVMWDESYADSILSSTIAAEDLNIKTDKNGSSSNTSGIGSYCLVITNKKVVPVELDSEYNYTAAIEKLRKLITDRSTLDDEELNKYRKELFEKLLEPTLAYLPLKADNIMIVPDGNLSFLPFDVLCNEDGLYLGEAWNLSVSPSVSVSMMAETNGLKTDSKTKEKMLAIGNPVYSQASGNEENRGFQKKFIKVDNTASQEELLAQYAKPETAGKYYQTRNITWSNIPGTGVEIHNLKDNAFSGKDFSLIEKTDATEEKVKALSASKDLSKYTILHFACHGYFDTLNYQMSSIVFSEVSKPLEQRTEDGYLTLSEATLLNLNANLVNLSACQTGLAQLRKGDGMTGLTRSFLVAGARNVGVTLWSVDDEATCEFMTRMYQKVQDYGYTYQQAYAEVKSEFRLDERWSSPYYWAAFILYE